jgi:hypothetical protein
LEVLDAAKNEITGMLPSWESLASLRSVDLSFNQIVGSLPAQWNNRSLQYIDLQQNKLSGGLPVEWSTLMNLTTLRLNNNELTGPIPLAWGPSAFTGGGGMAGLRVLHLENNLLADAVPYTFGLLQNVVEFVVYHNLLSGPLPSMDWAGPVRLMILCDKEQPTNSFCSSANATNPAIELAISNCTIRSSCSAAPPPPCPCNTTAARTQLMEFFNATGGSGWNNNEGWGVDGSSVCDPPSASINESMSAPSPFFLVPPDRFQSDGQPIAINVDLQRPCRGDADRSIVRHYPLPL